MFVCDAVWVMCISAGFCVAGCSTIECICVVMEYVRGVICLRPRKERIVVRL